jgi:hypothetical protein
MALRFKRDLARAVAIAMAVIQGSSGISAQGRAGPNGGTVYVNRPSQIAGVAMWMNVNVDGKTVGSIGNDQCIKLVLPAGRYTIGGSDRLWPFSFSNNVVGVDVRAGSSTYVLITPTLMMPGMYFNFPATVSATGRRC